MREGKEREIEVKCFEFEGGCSKHYIVHAQANGWKQESVDMYFNEWLNVGV